MNKSGKIGEDRLSGLPDSIIFEIIGLLPMREVVRTTVLSKRWKNLWTTIPYLNFDGHRPEFVSQALILWKGVKILKFEFDHSSILNKSVFCDIDVWVRFAKENGIEELNLDLYSMDDEAYGVPHILYSCSLLKVLSLRGCIFQIDGNVKVQWNQLRHLTIEGFLLDQNLINQVISGSPRLEVLILGICDNDENLSIRSTSLKKLWIERNFYDVEPSTVAELRIWSPNLEHLHIGGELYDKCSLMDVSSLTHLTLDFYYYHENDELFGETLGQIFQTIRHVENLTLSSGCIKVLGAMKDKYLASPLSNFKFLTIKRINIVEYEEIVDILRDFPQLKRLVIHSTYYASGIPANHVHCERNLPESYLLQLRTVEITCIEGDSLIFPFIETLLKHASKLQNITVRVSRIMPPSTPWFLEAQQKLLRMARSYPTAELIVAGH